jgi:hypothetical protein
MNSTKEKIRQVSLERIFSFVLLSKRSFDGCCAAKSGRESNCNQALLQFIYFMSTDCKSTLSNRVIYPRGRSVAQQNPVVKNNCYQALLQFIYFMSTDCKSALSNRVTYPRGRSFDGCCAANSSREI